MHTSNKPASHCTILPTTVYDVPSCDESWQHKESLHRVSYHKTSHTVRSFSLFYHRNYESATNLLILWHIFILRNCVFGPKIIGPNYYVKNSIIYWLTLTCIILKIEKINPFYREKCKISCCLSYVLIVRHLFDHSKWQFEKISHWNHFIKGMIVRSPGIRWIIFEHVQNLTTGYNRLRSAKIGNNHSVAHRRDPHTARLSDIS